jgi:AcrR family transcriptional regulator
MVQHTRTSAPSEPPGPRGEVTRQRILAVAQELFSQRGFDGTTVREIAGRVDITDPALYYYFRTKRLILEALMIQPAAAPPRSAPLSREQLVEHLYGLFMGWAEQTDMVRMLFREQMANDPASREFRRRAIEDLHTRIGPPLREMYGQRATVIAPALQTLLSGTVWDAILTYAEHCPEVVRQEMFRTRTRQLIELVLPSTPIERSQGEAPS